MDAFLRELQALLPDVQRLDPAELQRIITRNLLNWVPGNPNDRSIIGFCHRHGNSRGPRSIQWYRGLKKKKRAPREIWDGKNIIITVQAEAAWDREQSRPKGALARLISAEEKVRRERTRIAGLKSVEARRAAGRLPPPKER